MARKTDIRLRRSATTGAIPTTSNLNLGEIALNTFDGKLYTKTTESSFDQVVQVGSSTDSYHKIRKSQNISLTVKVITKTSDHAHHGSGSSSAYEINGVESPHFHLVPGNTYRFDQSDSSNSGHPLRFYYEADKTTAYTTGVTAVGTPGSSGAYTQIIPADSTPFTLHYQCSAHGYMGNRVDFGTRNLTGFDTDDLSEGSSNLYFTNARARSAISVSGDLSYNSSTGVISFSETSAATTRALISVTDAGGDGSLAYNNSTGVITYTGPSASEVQAHFSGGTGVTISSGSVAIGQAVATTSDVTFANIDITGALTDSAVNRGIKFDSTSVKPSNGSGGDANNHVDLGTTAAQFRNLYLSGNAVITGNLTVSGTTTTVNSTTVSIADPIFEIGESGSDDNLDRGIKMKYNSGGAKFAFFGYDDSDGKFLLIPDATDTSSVFTGSIGVLKSNIETGNTGLTVGDSTPFSDSSGTLTLQNIDAIDATTESTFEAAIDSLTNLTAVGTLTSGTWNATTIAVGNGGTGLTSASTSGFVMTSNGSGFVMQSIDGGTFS